MDKLYPKNSVNQVVLVGHAGAAPTLTYSDTGSVKSELILATHVLRGSRTIRTWHTILVRGRMAENLVKYIDKGMMVGVTGRLVTKIVEKKIQTAYVEAETVTYFGIKATYNEDVDELATDAPV